MSSVRRVRDGDWMSRSFLVGESDISPNARKELYYSTAFVQYVDTRPGGHWAINPPPQYTLSADLPVGGLGVRREGRDSSSGMGRLYHEAINQNMQLLNIRCGFPEYNGGVTFFSNMSDAKAAYMARTGRYPGFLWHLGAAVGTVLGLAYAAPWMIGSFVFKLLRATPSDKYYFLKPAMSMYWARVNQILNMIAVEMKIVKPLYAPVKAIPGVTVDEMGELGLGMGRNPTDPYTAYQRETLNRYMPDVFNKNGTIDAYNLATRTQRLATQQRRTIASLMDNNTSLEQLMAELSERKFTMMDFTDYDKPTFENLIEEWMGSPGGYWDEEQANNESYVEEGSRGVIRLKGEQGDGKLQDSEVVEGTLGSLWRNAKTETEASLTDGGGFLTLAVSKQDGYTDSFSNTTGESAIKATLDGATSAGNQARFSTSGGKTGIGLIDGVIGGVSSMLAGGLSAIGLDGIYSLFTGSYVDIPHEWKNSNSSIHAPSYKLELRSWSGDPMSRLLNLYYPLAHILAFALPISTGRSTYSSPFLCEYYHTGMAQSRLAIVDNLSVTVGQGNIGFTSSNEPLGIDVSFSLKPLAPIMHTPISNFDGLIRGTFKDPDEFGDYIARITARSFIDQVFLSRRLANNIVRKITNAQSFWTVSKAVTVLTNTNVGQFISAVKYPITDRFE